LCGVLVFRLDPAASPSASAAPPLTHHSPLTTSHLILDLTHHLSLTILASHSPLITSHSSFTTHHYATSHYISLITSHTSLITAPLITSQLITAPLSLSRSRRSTQSLVEELRRAWSPLGPRLPFAWQAQYTEPPGGAAARVVAAGAAAGFRVAGAVRRASIFLTRSFSHHFVTHHFDTPSVTPLCHTPSFTHHFVTHHLSHTTLSHTIFHTPLCHTPSFTHHFVTHHLSQFRAPSFTHHLSHSKSHTP